MRTLIVGAGAMGSLFAARLALAGIPVTLYSHPSPHVATIAATGLRLIERGEQERCVSLPVMTEPARLPPFDLALVMVKAWATESALAPLASHLASAIPVLSLQNGLGNEAAIGRALPGWPVLLGTTAQGARRLGPGVVRPTGAGPTVLGAPAAGADPTARAIARLLTDAGIATAPVDDVQRWLWRKLAVNAAINGPTALGEVPNGSIATDARLRETAMLLAGEIAATARAQGIELDDIEATVLEVARATAENHSSMWQDVVAGRRTEVGAIYDTAIASGAAAGLANPVCRVIAALIHAREAAREVPDGRD